MQKIIAKIHLGNIRQNAELLKSHTGKKLCAVVKANAYGHGAEEVVNALESVADYFAVALIEEGLCIRAPACGKPILVFTPPLDEEEACALIDNGFIATVPDLWTAKLLVRACQRRKKPLKVHLKVNTGMNRYGMNGSMLGKVCKFLSNESLVEVEGLYTHLCECTNARANLQYRLFLKHCLVARRYFPDIITHLGGTYAAICNKNFDVDMFRVGLGLYGYLPDGKYDKTLCSSLQKGMTVYAKAVANHQFSYGGAGYGKALTKTKAKDIKYLSVCRFGYADGFLRQKNNGVCGADLQLNNLCMDVSIRKGRLRRGKTLPLLLDADETARATNTISYEVLCAASRRAELIYDND